jgi:hypothetical protein
LRYKVAVTARVLYLDMNVWVELARAATPEWVALREDLEKATTEGRVVLPLSTGHYLELWHRSATESREDVGRVMRDLSGYATLASVEWVRHAELVAAIDTARGISSTGPDRGDVLGQGAAHAFGSPYGRFRFVESLADDTTPEGPATSPPDGWPEPDELRGPGWEWFQLVGTAEVVAKDGIERTPQHRRGTAYAATELALREALETEPALRARLTDLIVAQELAGLTDDINTLCRERDWDPHRLFLAHTGPGGPPAAAQAFVRSLPTVHVFATLRYWKHRDTTHPWEQHDFTDLAVLATAIPYCDAVVTERRWAHLVRVSGLAGEYGTRVGSGIRGVRDVLGEL